MKKKLLALLIGLLTVISLCACGKEATATPTAEPTAEPKQEITIRFFNGDTLLGELKTYKGETVKGYEQFEKLEGYTLTAWYSTPTFLEASKRDLATATFTDDTKIFGSFKSNAVADDTRSWYIVGEGSSKVLKTSAWAGSAVDAAGKELCQLKPTGNKNEFSITLDLYKDDKFQLVYDWQWDGQKGYGLFSKLDATMFESGGGISGEKDKANVSVLMDGNYTVTITTDPDDAKQDVITITRNGDAAPADPADEPEPYVPNDSTQAFMKGSWVADWSENIELKRNEGTFTYTATKELAAGTELYFMLWENGADTGVGMNSTAVTDDASKALLEEAYNVKVKEAGTYTFTVNAETLTITITK